MTRNGPVKRIVPGLKDESGAYAVQSKDLSIDALMRQGLEAIHGVMKACLFETKSGFVPSRECVQNLKDAMSMLQELKKQEQEIIEELSYEELEKAAKND